MNEAHKKVYLGDSVYVEDLGFHILLTTENGFGPSNEIYLEDKVISNFISFLERSRGVRITVCKVDQGKSG